VEYTGRKQSKDLPFCEVRIPRSSIERYAREAEVGSNDARPGMRIFEMSPLQKQDALQRRLRFQAMLPKVLVGAVISKVGAEQGLYIPSEHELAKLQLENQSLNEENEVLRSWAGPACCDGSPNAKAKAVMTLALHFEIVPRAKVSLTDQRLIRSASFQDGQD